MIRVENLSTLEIHKLTQEQYDKAAADNKLNPNALYLTPDESTSGAAIDAAINKGNGINSIIENNIEHNQAAAAYSHAEGNATITAGKGAHAEGGAPRDTRYIKLTLTEIDGEPNTYQVVWHGKMGNAAIGQKLISINYNSDIKIDPYIIKAVKDSNIELDRAVMDIDHESIYWINTGAIGDYSHSEGYGTVALGDTSHAEGNSTAALGKNSHAEGDNAIASGDYSHAEGKKTIARGEYSHVEGAATIAFGSYAHAEGGCPTPVTATISGDANSKTYKIQGIAANKITADSVVKLKEFPYTSAKIRMINEESSTVELGQTLSVGLSLINASVEIYNSGIALGDYSHTEGYNTYARKEYAHAEGYNTQAKGRNSHAEGHATVAYSSAHAEGQNTIAEGGASHAEGLITKALGIASHAEGGQTIATRSGSHAEGYKTRAERGASHAEGRGTLALGSFSHTEGYCTTAVHSSTHAEGTKTRAGNSNAHAEGHLSYAKGINAHAEGHLSYAKGINAHAEGKNTGAVGDQSHAEGYYTQAGDDFNGIAAHAEGYETKALEDYSHAEGSFTTAENISAHAEGHRTRAGTGFYVIETPGAQHAEGSYTEAFGQSTHAEGNNTVAFGNHSHAEGNHTRSHGKDSHSEGVSTVSSGDASHAEGRATLAFGINSHAEGQGSRDDSAFSAYSLKRKTSLIYECPNGISVFNVGDIWTTQNAGAAAYVTEVDIMAKTVTFNAPLTSYDTEEPIKVTKWSGGIAFGENAHSEGCNTIAKADHSHTEGNETNALGVGSHAEGYRTYATGDYSHVEGRYNEIDQNGTYAHILGGGTSPSNRRNIHTIDWDGNAMYAGMMTINGGLTLASGSGYGQDIPSNVDEGRIFFTPDNTADYIVSSGETTIDNTQWYYELYNSGTVKAWGKKTMTLAASTWKNLNNGISEYDASLNVTLPFAIDSIINETINIYNSTDFTPFIIKIATGRANSSKTKWYRIAAHNVKPTSAITIDINFSIVGRQG